MTVLERMREKLVEFSSYIDDLRGLREVTWNEFQSNVMLRRGIERTLQIAGECALDLGNMLIAHFQWRAPESNRDVFRVLSEHKVLDDYLTERFVKVASFRNIQVHEYTRIDPAIVFALLKKLPEDLLAFRDRIAAVL